MSPPKWTTNTTVLSKNILLTRRHPPSMHFAPPITLGLMKLNRFTSTILAAACTRPRSFNSTWRCWHGASTAIPIPVTRPRRRRRARRKRPRVRAALLQRQPGRVFVIFTPNASGALKLLGESYPFVPGGNYLLTFDNHNSVNGIREFAQRHGATVTYAPVLPPDLRVDAARLEASLAQKGEQRQPVRLPGAVEFLRRPARSRLDRAGAGIRLGRAARRGGVRADQPLRPGAVSSRISLPCLSTRFSATRPASAR